MSTTDVSSTNALPDPTEPNPAPAIGPGDEPVTPTLASRASERSRQWLAGLPGQVWRWWRHSLQLRVAATTFVVSGVVVVIVGIFLVSRINAGVLNAKRDAAIEKASSGLSAAEVQLAGFTPGDIAGQNTALQQVQTELAATGTEAGLYTIVIETPGSTPGGAPTIPVNLRRLVQRGDLVTQYAPVPTGTEGRTVSGLIVGEPVSVQGGTFELYYLFPLTAEAETINLVQRTVLIAGLVLVVSVVLIGYLVTRQVVKPVRVAAQTAARLAAGDLAQRIKVHGTDDIAQLGQSFNEMAGSLQRQIRRLEELSRVQRRFTSDVSHELRTPLTTIRMASELLHSSRDAFTPELARSAELLQAELDRFESLLGDLFEISRYDAGVARLEIEPTDLRIVVGNAISASQVLALRHATEILVNLPEQPVIVEMDARRVERILRNLLGNALDHAEGRPVVVMIGSDEQAAAVTVRDHGVGLRPGEAGLVFNRFWRGDPSRSRLTGGTGLGLSISLEDARLHGGWLQAWGERGLGAQFRLTLPRQAGQLLTGSPLPLEPEALIDVETT
jgi:two-component system sensor histidine kinase MtrB